MWVSVFMRTVIQTGKSDTKKGQTTWLTAVPSVT